MYKISFIISDYMRASYVYTKVPMENGTVPN